MREGFRSKLSRKTREAILRKPKPAPVEQRVAPGRDAATNPGLDYDGVASPMPEVALREGGPVFDALENRLAENTDTDQRWLLLTRLVNAALNEEANATATLKGRLREMTTPTERASLVTSLTELEFVLGQDEKELKGDMKANRVKLTKLVPLLKSLPLPLLGLLLGTTLDPDKIGHVLTNPLLGFGVGAAISSLPEVMERKFDNLAFYLESRAYRREVTKRMTTVRTLLRSIEDASS
jgi:hypothetical protein